ncbi:MAG: ABC transporter substrate-binding protein, partial [Gemmatimonadales bacterium]
MRLSKKLAGTIVAGLMLMTAGAQAQQAENKLRWASTSAIAVPDPYYNYLREANMLNAQLVWDTLIYRNPVNGEYEPLLATEWKWLDDKTLEFRLRSDVSFHNGKPLTAKDVVYTYNYIADPANKISVQSNVSWIDHAEAIDDQTVKIFLDAPFPPALEYIATLHAILPEDVYGKDGQINADIGLVGTGPYKFTEFVPSTKILLTKWD